MGGIVMGKLVERLQGKIKSTDSLGKAYRTVIKAAFGQRYKLEKSLIDELVVKINSDPKLRVDVIRLISSVMEVEK
jgi:hypothetical protein